MCPIDRHGQWVDGIPCVDPGPQEFDPNSLRTLCAEN
jgi:hypothetical protein